jgi:AAHS family 4-hydroxybenzoate transporter-like MFS transporter
MLMVFCAGFFVIGTQGILTAATPIFYHTSFRAKGNGIAMGIAKIGSIGGPVIGGILIAQLSLNQMFYVNSGVIFIAAVLFLILGIFSRTIYKEMRGSEHGIPPINVTTEG